MACRSVEKGKAAAEDIKATGIPGSVSSIQLDVTDQDSIVAAEKYVKEKFGVVDVLVNNAGIYSQAPDLKTQLETTFNTNTIGAALMSHAFEPLLLKSKRGYLIHIGSGLGSMTEAGDPNRFDYKLPATAYRMSKAALSMLAVQDSKELGPRGVKVFIACPGLVRSSLRGEAEEQISAGGSAVDPSVSAQLMLSIIQGHRDADAGKFLHKDGVYHW